MEKELKSSESSSYSASSSGMSYPSLPSERFFSNAPCLSGLLARRRRINGLTLRSVVRWPTNRSAFQSAIVHHKQKVGHVTLLSSGKGKGKGPC